MCKQRTALDMILKQKDCGGMSDSALQLHQKQCEDYEAMQREVSTLKERVNSIDKKVDDVLDKLDKLSKDPTFLEVFKSCLGNKVVQALIASAIATWVGSAHLPEILSFFK